MTERIQYFWVPESRRVPVPQMPCEVSTVHPAVGGHNQDVVPVVDDPVHGRTVLLEDRTHDWNWQHGVLRYYSRFVDHSVWIRVDFGVPCAHRGCDANTARPDGNCMRHRKRR